MICFQLNSLNAIHVVHENRLPYQSHLVGLIFKAVNRDCLCRFPRSSGSFLKSNVPYQ